MRKCCIKCIQLLYIFKKNLLPRFVTHKKLPILKKLNIITIISIYSILCLTLILPNLFNPANTFHITSQQVIIN